MKCMARKHRTESLNHGNRQNCTIFFQAYLKELFGTRIIFMGMREIANGKNYCYAFGIWVNMEKLSFKDEGGRRGQVEKSRVPKEIR
jgi:hypothetical protein